MKAINTNRILVLIIKVIHLIMKKEMIYFNKTKRCFMKIMRHSMGLNNSFPFRITKVKILNSIKIFKIQLTNENHLSERINKANKY